MAQRILWGLSLHVVITVVASYDPNQFWQVRKLPEPDIRPGITRELERIRAKCVVTCSEQCAKHDECNVVSFDDTVGENEPNCRLLECRPWQSLCHIMIKDQSTILYRYEPQSSVYVPWNQPRFERLRKKREADTPPGEENTNSSSAPTAVPVPVPAPAVSEDTSGSVSSSDVQDTDTAPSLEETNANTQTQTVNISGDQATSENVSGDQAISENNTTEAPANNENNSTRPALSSYYTIPNENNTETQPSSENNIDNQTPSEKNDSQNNTTESEKGVEIISSQESEVESSNTENNQTSSTHNPDNDVKTISGTVPEANDNHQPSGNTSDTESFENIPDIQEGNESSTDIADIQPVLFSDNPVPNDSSSEETFVSNTSEVFDPESGQGVTSLANQTVLPKQGGGSVSTESPNDDQNKPSSTVKIISTTPSGSSDTTKTNSTTQITSTATYLPTEGISSDSETTTKSKLNQTEEENSINTAFATTVATTNTNIATAGSQETTPNSDDVTMNGTESMSMSSNQSDPAVVAEEELLADMLLEAALEESEAMEIENSTNANSTDTLSQSADVSNVSSTSHMMMVVLVSALSIGLFIFLVVSIMVGKRVIEGWRRRHYSRIDYLVNGMYN